MTANIITHHSKCLIMLLTLQFMFVNKVFLVNEQYGDGVA